MKRSFRLTRSEDISRVRQEGKTYVHQQLILGVLPNLQGSNRAAIIASRSVGGAVQRNLAKRRIRSAVQSLTAELYQGFDLVIIARKPFLAHPYQSNLAALRSLLNRARLFLKENLGD